MPTLRSRPRSLHCTRAPRTARRRRRPRRRRSRAGSTTRDAIWSREKCTGGGEAEQIGIARMRHEPRLPSRAPRRRGRSFTAVLRRRMRCAMFVLALAASTGCQAAWFSNGHDPRPRVVRWRMLRLDAACLAMLAVSGCAPAWISEGTNPPQCPVNALPPGGACPTLGVSCHYVENTGDSHRAPIHQPCACTSGGWACQFGTSLVDASLGGE